MEYLSLKTIFLVGLGVVEIMLAVIAFIHVLKHPHYRFGNKFMWLFIVTIFCLLGPVAYFVWGRGRSESGKKVSYDSRLIWKNNILP